MMGRPQVMKPFVRSACTVVAALICITLASAQEPQPTPGISVIKFVAPV
jgi:hypothetical protein